MPDTTAAPETAATETAAAAAPVADTAGVELPDELLKVPAFQALVAGQPGAFSAVLEQFKDAPEAKLIAANKDALMGAGFGLYRSMDGARGVVFNQLYVAPDELKAADQSGSLLELAPDFQMLNSEIAKAGAANPVLMEGERPTGFKSAPSQPLAAALGMGGGEGMPAGAQKTLTSKRAANMMPGAPTSGPVPGSGRLLSSVLKPII